MDETLKEGIREAIFDITLSRVAHDYAMFLKLLEENVVHIDENGQMVLPANIQEQTDNESALEAVKEESSASLKVKGEQYKALKRMGGLALHHLTGNITVENSTFCVNRHLVKIPDGYSIGNAYAFVDDARFKAILAEKGITETVSFNQVQEAVESKSWYIPVGDYPNLITYEFAQNLSVDSDNALTLRQEAREPSLQVLMKFADFVEAFQCGRRKPNLTHSDPLSSDLDTAEKKFNQPLGVFDPKGDKALDHFIEALARLVPKSLSCKGGILTIHKNSRNVMRILTKLASVYGVQFDPAVLGKNNTFDIGLYRRALSQPDQIYEIGNQAFLKSSEDRSDEEKMILAILEDLECLFENSGRGGDIKPSLDNPPTFQSSEIDSAVMKRLNVLLKEGVVTVRYCSRYDDNPEMNSISPNPRILGDLPLPESVVKKYNQDFGLNVEIPQGALIVDVPNPKDQNLLWDILQQDVGGLLNKFLGGGRQ